MICFSSKYDKQVCFLVNTKKLQIYTKQFHNFMPLYQENKQTNKQNTENTPQKMKNNNNKQSSENHIQKKEGKKTR